MSEPVTVVGGGLAGCEAAYQLAKRDVPVRLWEMRPGKQTEAHVTDGLAELVCSNSFRDDSMGTAVGVLKAEMRITLGIELHIKAGIELLIAWEEPAIQVAARALSSHVRH